MLTFVLQQLGVMPAEHPDKSALLSTPQKGKLRLGTRCHTLEIKEYP